MVSGRICTHEFWQKMYLKESNAIYAEGKEERFLRKKYHLILILVSTMKTVTT